MRPPPPWSPHTVRASPYLAVVTVALGLSACTRHGPTTGSPPVHPAAETPTVAPTDGSPPGLPAEVPGAIMARVTACEARVRAHIPVELSTALDALDDDTLVNTACRLDVAVDSGTPALCAGIALPVLRDTCTARVAMALGRAALCPLAAGLHGHDPTCVAVATRRPGLCAAANVTDRGRCEALCRRDLHACDPLDPLLRPACVRDVTALAGRLPPMVITPARAITAAILVVTALPDGSVPEEYPWRAVARGVLRADDNALWLMDSTRAWPSRDADAPDGPLAAVRIPLQAAHLGEATPAEARVVLSGHRVLDTTEPPTVATARMTALGTQPGDRVHGVITVTGVVGTSPVRVVLDVDTWVRDVVPAAGLRDIPLRLERGP